MALMTTRSLRASKSVADPIAGVDAAHATVRGKRPRCERCVRPLAHCLCPLIPLISSRTRVVVLQHPDESRHAMNTARLAVLGLRNAQLHVGRKFDPGLWTVAGYQSRLLFPGEGAEVISQATNASLGAAEPTLLVVPDGTWRHARQLLVQHPELAALPRVTLPEGLVTRYRIRYAGDPRALSTIEAVAAALDALEAPASFEALLAPFEALVAGQIEAMGEERYRRHHVLREGSRGHRKRSGPT